MEEVFCVVAERTEQVVAVLRGPFLIALLKEWFNKIHTTHCQSAPTDEFDRIDGGGRRRLATSFFSFSCPVSYYCKEKKKTYTLPSQQAFTGRDYIEAQVKKGQETRRQQKRKMEKKRPKKKKKKVQISPEGVSSLFLFLYTLLRIPLYIRFSLPSIWGLETRHQPFKWRESQKGDYGSQSEKGMKKNLKNIRVALMSGAEIPEHVQQRME